MNQSLQVSASRGTSCWPRFVPLGLLLMLAALLRFYDLGANPAWYGDEGICLDIADGIARGRWEVGALKYTFFGLHHPYPPGYFLAAALLTRVFGCKLLVVRLMTACASLITVYLVYQLTEEALSRRAGMVAALFAAVHPPFVVFSRWGFVTGLAMLFTTLTVWAVLRYRRTRSFRWLIAASVGCGLAVSTSYWTLPLALWLIVLTLLTRPRAALTAGAVIGVSAVAIFTLGAWLHGLPAVLYDLGISLTPSSTSALSPGGPSLSAQLIVLFSNSKAFLLLDLYTAAGAASLLLVPRRAARYALVGALACLALPSVYLRGDIIENFFYNALPYYPLVFVGLGALAAQGWQWMRTWTEELSVSDRALAALLFLALACGAVLHPFVQSARGLLRGFETNIDAYTVQNHEDALALADWLNGHIRNPDREFVLTTGQVGWLFRCRLATLLNSVAWTGRSTLQVPSGYRHDMFVFDPSPEKASFLVADQVTYLWMIRQPGCARLLYQMDQRGWPLVYERGEYLVFANPDSYVGPALEPDPLLLRDYDILMQEIGVDMDARRYETAARAYRKALGHFGPNPTLLSNLGVATAKSGELEQGAAYLREALKLAPGHAAARRSLEGVERDIAEAQPREGDTKEQ